jgi:hypothetical protein
MPGYVVNILINIRHDNPKHPQDTPFKYVTPVYGADTKYTIRDDTPPLSTKHCNNIKKITGSVLYYTRAVDPTVTMPLNGISMEQTKASV